MTQNEQSATIRTREEIEMEMARLLTHGVRGPNTAMQDVHRLFDEVREFGAAEFRDRVEMYRNRTASMLRDMSETIDAKNAEIEMLEVRIAELDSLRWEARDRLTPLFAAIGELERENICKGQFASLPEKRSAVHGIDIIERLTIAAEKVTSAAAACLKAGVA